jgi:hypothetical protein
MKLFLKKTGQVYSRHQYKSFKMQELNVHCATVDMIFHMKSKHVADKMHDSASNFDLK